MTTSISGTVVVPPSQGFDIELYGRIGRQVEKRLDSARRAGQRENERKLKEARTQAKHECELMAVEHAKAMMERDLFQAIELEKTDPALAAKLRGRILDRGIGKPPEADAEAAQRRRGGNVNDLTDFLHAISAASNAVAGISHQPGTPVPERDVTPVEHDPDAQWFEYPTSTDGGDDAQ